jgi:HD-like signal output (HDOD) protein/GGDEF domain-containing protein
MNEFEERLLASPSLPTIPQVAQRLLELLERDAPVGELAAAIALDASLTAQLLRSVNSSMYGLRREVTSVQESLVYLGTNTVRTIALSFAFVGGLRQDGISQELDAHWRACLMTALAARRFAKALDTWDSEEAFLTGLVSDVGALVLYDQDPAYRELFARFIRGAGDLNELEHDQNQIDTTHSRIGGALLRTWGFPEGICGLVEHHHLESTDPEARIDARILEAAWLCGRTLSLPSYHHETPELLRWLVEHLGLRAEDANGVLEALPDELREIAATFEIPASQQRSYNELLIEANQRLRELALRSEERFAQLTAADSGRSGFGDLRTVLDLHPDPITGLLPRAELAMLIDTYLPRARQRRCPLGLLAIEMTDPVAAHHEDKLSAEELLPALLEQIARYTRDEDEVGRLDHARIGVLLVDCEGADLARAAQRIHGALTSLGLEHAHGSVEVRIAIGAADVVPSREDIGSQALLAAAEAALVEARELGEVRLQR